jgi:hypothetical protein
MSSCQQQKKEACGEIQITIIHTGAENEAGGKEK